MNKICIDCTYKHKNHSEWPCVNCCDGDRFKEIKSIEDLRNLLEITEMAFEYIDAIPKELNLPTMPGFDRDKANVILEKARKEIKAIDTDINTSLAIVLATIPNFEQRQDSTTDQLKDLALVAVRLGMYDAADFIKRTLK